MLEDHISYLIKNTIERIERVPKDKILELLQEIYQERELLRTIINFSLRRSVFVMNKNESVVFFNDFAVKTGIIVFKEIWKLSEDIQKYVFDVYEYLINSKERYYSLTARVNIKRGGEDIYSEKVFLIEGSTQDFEVFYYVVSDITDDFLSNLNRIQEDSVNVLSNVVSGVAHEVKNPLSAMYLHAKILKRLLEKNNFDKEYFTKEVDVILSEIGRLNEIVDNFMYYLRPYKFAEKYENINEIVREVVEFFLPEFREKSIKIDVVLDESLPLILCDKNLLKQAIINLVKNSIDALQGDNKYIRLSSYFMSRFDGDFIVVEVKDNGVGIPDDVKLRIFEPFFTTKEAGTGIGLSIVYRIVKLHKGTVDFVSKDGETVFRILLPVRGTKELKYDRS